MGDFAKMKKAYNASKSILQAKMKKEREEDFKKLKEISDNEILIVKGSYDRIEDVFDILEIPYGLIMPYELDQINLRPTQTLIINCPGSGISSEVLNKIKKFVEKGGFLWSTDWVLLEVLEKIFPEYVKFNGVKTNDDVVRVEVVDKSHPYLKGLFEGEADPQWWLETSSYPITLLKKDKIKVLIQSREMKQKYGESPIVILFNYGKGEVLHMTSHYYLQRTELRTKRHMKSAVDYAVEELNISEEEIDKEKLKDISLGEAEAAYSSTQFIVNAMVERKKKIENIKKDNEKDEKMK
ncbi:MAG: hypothetical protein ACTSRZ_09565 [Promethearchaeota archaeon]